MCQSLLGTESRVSAWSQEYLWRTLSRTRPSSRLWAPIWPQPEMNRRDLNNRAKREGGHPFPAASLYKRTLV